MMTIMAAIFSLTCSIHCLHLINHELPLPLRILSNYNSTYQQKLLKLKSKSGVSLNDLLSTASLYPSLNGKALYMADSSCFNLFRPIIEPLLVDYYPCGCNPYTVRAPNYHYDPDSKREIIIDSEDQQVLDKAAISTRMRVVRNIEAFPFQPNMNKGQREQMEGLLVSKLEHLNGIYKGKYLPLSQISKQEQKELFKKHLLFTKFNESIPISKSGVYNDWPAGRGIFLSSNNKFMAWIGQEDHFRLIYLDQGANYQEIYQKLRSPVSYFEHHFNFSFDPQLGYLSTCVGNIGTGFTVSTLMRLENLTFQETSDFCDKNGLLVRGTDGIHSPVNDHLFTIQNQVRFCHDTKTLIENFTKNAAALVRLNQRKDTLDS